MDTSAAPSPASRPLSVGSILLRLCLVAGVVFVLGVGFLLWTFLPRGDVRALRNIALAELPGKWERRVEVRVGGMLIGAGQIAAYFAHAPAEARAALACVESAEVSVHERIGVAAEFDAGRLLARCRDAMTARGWSPLVTVHDHGDTVAVFTEDRAGGDTLRLCVLVQDGDKLVVVSCAGNPAPLAELLQGKLAEHRRRPI